MIGFDRVDVPLPLPTKSVYRMRMIAEVFLQPVFVAIECQPRIGDPVRVRNQRITGVTAHIALSADLRGRRAQYIDALIGKAGERTASRGRKLDLRVAGTERQGCTIRRIGGRVCGHGEAILRRCRMTTCPTL